MDMNELRTKLNLQYLGDPQRQALVIGALASVEAGLRGLASLGHRFEVEPAGAGVVLLWPKMLYKDGSSPLAVENRRDFEAALSNGWREHPTDPKIEVGPRPNGEALAAPPPAPPPSPVEHPDMPLANVALGLSDAAEHLEGQSLQGDVGVQSGGAGEWLRSPSEEEGPSSGDSAERGEEGQDPEEVEGVSESGAGTT